METDHRECLETKGLQLGFSIQEVTTTSEDSISLHSSCFIRKARQLAMLPEDYAKAQKQGRTGKCTNRSTRGIHIVVGAYQCKQLPAVSTLMSLPGCTNVAKSVQLAAVSALMSIFFRCLSLAFKCPTSGICSELNALPLYMTKKPPQSMYFYCISLYFPFAKECTLDLVALAIFLYSTHRYCQDLRH